jgi:DNA-directed RNA polymerase specialized sigma24 family protein
LAVICGSLRSNQPAIASDCESVKTALRTVDKRDVIELAYWGRYTQADMAAKLEVPLGTIKSRTALGLRKLARTLAP